MLVIQTLEMVYYLKNLFNDVETSLTKLYASKIVSSSDIAFMKMYYLPFGRFCLWTGLKQKTRKIRIGLMFVADIFGETH